MAAQARQRGEGKIGCIVSLVVLAIGIAVGFKVIPVYFTNNQLVDAADDLAGRAGAIPMVTLERQLRDKIREIDIPEAAAPGAVTISLSEGGENANCSVHLKYTRKVDLFGVMTIPIETDKTLVKTVYMNIR